MANDLKFVDTVATSPTTLLDLNDAVAGGFYLKSLSAPPPQVRRSLADAIVDDGQLMSASAYDNRVISLAFELLGTADQTALAIQNLGRILNQPRSLLRWKPQGQTHPVFFEVLRSPIENVDETLQHLLQNDRTVEVEVMARPAAVGLPVTGGPVTINNDSVSGTNPLFWRIGTGILGDLETPLFLSAAAQTDLGGRNIYMVSQALGFGKSQTTPLFIQTGDAQWDTFTAATGAWTTPTGDAAMSGGAYKRWTAANGSGGTLPSFAGASILSGVLPGEYRLLVRVRSTVAKDWTIWAIQRSVGGVVDTKVGKKVIFHPGGASPNAHWLDLGVFRMPYAAPDTDLFYGTQPATGVNSFRIQIQAPSDSVTGDIIDFDVVAFVPAGLDHAVATQSSFTGTLSAELNGIAPGTSTAIVFDSLNDAQYVLDTSGLIGSRAYVGRIGRLPTVVPGYDNSLHYFRHQGVGFQVASAGSQTPDVITTSTALSWKYWPRYLYVRPAST